MKILLDECVPWPLHKLLSGHECTNPQKCGWAGIKNGDLLHFAESRFDLFITADKNLRYQQNLEGRKLAILELSTNDWISIQENFALILAALGSVKPGDYLTLPLTP